MALFKGRSLAECAEGGRDNILQMRLIAALLVVLGHSALAGAGSLPFDPIHWLLPQTQAHLLGLFIFFMTSGFLITLSFERRPQLGRFLRARVLRLWPALVVCVLAWAFVLGPLLSEVPVRAYFDPSRPDSPWRYALINISLFKVTLSLPGVFVHNPAAGAVNGPLWTIPVEASMYLWVAAAGALRLLRLRWLASLAITALFGYILIGPMLTGHFEARRDLQLIVEGFFGAGAIACLLRRWIPVSTVWMVLIAVGCLAASHTRHALPCLWFAIGYFVLWFAYVPRLPALPDNIDLSYGVYLWAWPLQQTVVQFTHIHEPLLVFAIVAPVVLAVAAFSWRYVEKPALSLKDRRWRRNASLTAGPPLEMPLASGTSAS